MAYIYLLVAIVAEVTATFCLTLSNGFTRVVPSCVTVAGYAVAFYSLSLALRTIPTGMAYAIWSGIGTVLIALVCRVVLGQKLDLAAIAGMTLIICGVLVMNLLSGAGRHG
ncbi:quaternary ammonium compound-resistance protein EmrE [Komagataeibacter xylinus NBRC 13693]|uniref:Quaternary ammonium compound-resistance protein EmrE n=1 Tax=Komagataeibacter xylinus NBRC 13693 TaxID=1234668 RepID=A0A0D6Q862_KOMXY|nr:MULTISPECIES: multidrug efflux SMR transporter [Komagataeibacter]MBV0887379.1 multidrug efflux SMR transporter [Komagataeibacter oboediens]MBV1824300.1 multidrug efflux SMR transporter [Komagataeibacter oboediens]MCK9819879.1 multidrug efflux SMR transporter [Komagataeibacter oboediens]GAN99165.1 quaternary ammonium compound-resistance protein EmrE [Komagataeibacter xylinus NBRC 13693]